MSKSGSCSAVAFCLVLAACGGGGTLGDIDLPPPATPSAEGAYAGALSGSTTNNSFQMLVLDGGEYWVPYGTTTGDVFYLAGFIQGNGTSSNGSFSSSNGLDFGASPPLADTVSATYVAGVSVKGTVTSAFGAVGFEGSAADIAPYVYNTPAVPAAIAGNWTMSALDGSDVSVTIGASGAFTSVSEGCTSTGTVLPRPSGKNVFDVKVTAGASPCAVPGQAGHGIAVYSPLLGSSLTQLLVGLVSNDRSAGSAYVGTR